MSNKNTLDKLVETKKLGISADPTTLNKPSSMLLPGVFLLLCGLQLMATIGIQDHFTTVAMRGVILESDSHGWLDDTLCSVACVVQSKCLAFYLKFSGECMIVKGIRTLILETEETGVSSVEIWVRASKLNPNCVSTDFPIERGLSRYFLSNAEITWIHAKKLCESKGSKLAELSTTAERLFVYNHLKTSTKSALAAYIGLRKVEPSDVSTEGWQWLSGENLIEGWDVHQPDNQNGREDVGIMQFHNGNFHDTQENLFPYNALCECEIVSV